MALTDADRLQMTAIALMKHNHVLSGAVYEPVIYNDEGVYSYFYIDFLKAVAPFSLGMWNESIIIHDDAQVPVTNVVKVSDRLYKVYCDLSDKIHGITVLNKATSRLRFSIGGAKMPVFSVHSYIKGLVSYDSTTYLYETENFPAFSGSITEAIANDFWTAIDAGDISESVTFAFAHGTITETTNILLT